jgi:hypothetical protein
MYQHTRPCARHLLPVSRAQSQGLWAQYSSQLRCHSRGVTRALNHANGPQTAMNGPPCAPPSIATGTNKYLPRTHQTTPAVHVRGFPCRVTPRRATGARKLARARPPQAPGAPHSHTVGQLPSRGRTGSLQVARTGSNSSGKPGAAALAARSLRLRRGLGAVSGPAPSVAHRASMQLWHAGANRAHLARARCPPALSSRPHPLGRKGKSLSSLTLLIFSLHQCADARGALQTAHQCKGSSSTCPPIMCVWGGYRKNPFYHNLRAAHVSGDSKFLRDSAGYWCLRVRSP